MKKKYILYLMLATGVLALSGCKKEVVKTEIETSSETEVSSEYKIDGKFAVDETFTAETIAESKSLEQVKKDNTAIKESIGASLEKHYETVAQEELDAVEKEEELRSIEVETVNDKGETESVTLDLFEAQDGYFERLTNKIIFKELTYLDAVYSDIDKNMEGQPVELVSKMKTEAKELFEYWEVEHKRLENQPRPWTKEELEGNPLLSQYTREEIEAIDKAAKNAGFE